MSSKDDIIPPKEKVENYNKNANKDKNTESSTSDEKIMLLLLNTKAAVATKHKEYTRQT